MLAGLGMAREPHKGIHWASAQMRLRESVLIEEKARHLLR